MGKERLSVTQFMSMKNKYGITPLMKAAYKGNLDLIKDFMSESVPKNMIDVIDHRGLTALSYACLSGHLNVVAFLVEVGKSRIEGGELPGIQPWVEVFTPSPLVLASFSGHMYVVCYLLNRGVDVNARVGSPKGCTAVMIACWMRRMDIVKLLIGAGASFDSEMDDWVKLGLRKLKRLSTEYPISDWDSHGWQIKYKGSAENPATKKTPQTAKKDQLFLLSSDDMEDATRLIKILKADRASNAISATIDEVEISSGKLDLTEHLPSQGTELDEAFMQVYKCITQLAVAANQHDKTTYVVIAAKAIRFSTAILELIESMRTIDRSPKDAVVPISPNYSPVLSNKLLESSLLAKSDIASILVEQAKTLKTEFQESLMFTTKIACGIWPPTTALSDMMQSAVALSKSCKSLVDLSNCLGFYPILDKQLILQSEPSQETRLSADIESSATITVENEEEGVKGWPRPNLVTYEKYKQLNDLLNVEQLSKTMTTKPSPADAVKIYQKDAGAVVDPDLEYFKALEHNLKQFVISVTELKKSQSQKQKERYMQAANLISVRANEIIDEIQSFDLFVDFADSFDSVVLDEEDIELIEKTGVKLNVCDFPASALFLLDIAQQEVIETSTRIEELGREASFVWATPEMERKMLEACYPCVLAVKKLFSVAKAVAGKIRVCWEGDLRRQQEWNRTTTQNGNVMALFEAWKGTGTGSSEQYDIAKLKLDDKIEGIVFDPKLNSVKGGQLSKLVELITSHNNYESELASILLMCHHSFTTSVELLKCLTTRYEKIVPPINLNEKEFTAWFEIKVKPIQQNVLKCLVTWMSLYFEEDFLCNEILLSNTRDFIEKTVVIDWEVNGKLLLGTMEVKLASVRSGIIQQPKQATKISKAFGLFSGIDPSVLFSDASRIIELDPLEFAKQLTISEYDEFVLVRASECLDQIWASKIEKERAVARLQALSRKATTKSAAKEYMSSPQSAISKMISHTNNLTIWIATVIISCSNVKIRVILLKYFAQCAIKCREIKNYNGITGIVAGLSMAPVARLHRTPKGQYASYRKEMKDIKLPAIPFLGLFFTDLTFLDLGNPELLPNPADANPTRQARLINFDKCRKIHAVIKEIQKFQASPFPWPAIDGLQDFFGRIGETKAKFFTETPVAAGEEGSNLSGLGIATEDELYDQSLVIEPKEEELDDDSGEEAS
ncbi:hypothetical protein HDU98_002544 [Podochytrium sp. JEL0797]|nr:hypothetical protein HDU98_002544 [Podochytrium sp. JEL0797]